MILLVCGGRRFFDQARVFAELDKCLAFYGDGALIVVQGGAPGADRLAEYWCAHRGVPCVTMPAAWVMYGTKAGTIRNEWMLEIMKPNAVLAFPGGTGTAHMKRIANRAGIAVYEG